LSAVRRRLKSQNRQSEIGNVIVPVAQLDRASDFGSEGWGFESLQARIFSLTALPEFGSNQA
jgi:hypothetical protein